MPGSVSGKRYAQAVFEIAEGEKKLEEWRHSLKRINGLIQAVPELVAFLENSKVSFASKRRLMTENLKDIHSLAFNLFLLLIEKGKVGLLSFIITDYERLLDVHYGIEHARVITAIPVDDGEKAKLISKLEALTGHKVVTDLEVAPDIVGGVVVQIGDKLIDGSLKSKLQALRKSLVEAGK